MCSTATARSCTKNMEPKSKIAILGGSFNPPHNGHVHLLNAFRENMHFDKVLILPAGIPPHKQAAELAAGEHRLAMCRLAFPDAEVSDIEVKTGGKNYTADTLEIFKRQYPQAQLYFIMGTDMLLSFASWRDPERIVRNAVLLCDCRDEKTSAAQLREFAKTKLHLSSEQCIISDVVPLPLSSTQVRDACRRGESITALVPPAVAEYIKKEGLYGG